MKVVIVGGVAGGASAAARIRRLDERAEIERARKELDMALIKGVNAAIALGEATAKAVQRIPDAHCNGDMSDALHYAAQVKHSQKDFLTKQGIEHLHTD